MIKTKRISFSLVFTMALKCLSNPHFFFFSFWPYHLIKNKQTKKKKRKRIIKKTSEKNKTQKQKLRVKIFHRERMRVMFTQFTLIHQSMSYPWRLEWPNQTFTCSLKLRDNKYSIPHKDPMKMEKHKLNKQTRKYFS